MVEGAGVIIGVTVCVIGVLIAACWWIDKRARKGIADFDTYGDGMNPDALRDWRKAKWPMEARE